jgi:hypothetical protein
MKFHKLADLFPLLPDDEVEELAEDIKKNGQKIKIVTHQGKILEGRNRYLACKKAGVEPRFAELPANQDPLAYVISMNIRRRHLTQRQKAELLIDLIPEEKLGRPSKDGKSGQDGHISTATIAKATGVSTRTVRRARKAAGKTTPTKKREERKGWTAEELKKDQELADHLDMIESVYGTQDTKAIRTGTIAMKRADVLFLAKIPKENMLKIQDLIFTTGWTPKKCIEFLNNEPDDDSKVLELKYLCLATKGKYWTHVFEGFTFTVKANQAIAR